MKILYATDLQRYEWKYRQVLQVAREQDVTMVVNGGDMMPDQSVEDFLQFLDEHFGQFDAAGIRYLCLLANDDPIIFDRVFDEICKRHPAVFNLAQRKIQVDSYEFVGMNWVVDYPFRMKDRCRRDDKDYAIGYQYGSALLSAPNHQWREIPNWPVYVRNLPTIEDELNNLPRPQNMKRTIYVIHMPPTGVQLATCYNAIEGIHDVGSRAVYRFILERQPKLTLHGHIHESPDLTKIWQTKIGQTISIQPGQHNDRELVYVIGDLKKMRFERFVEKKRKGY